LRRRIWAIVLLAVAAAVGLAACQSTQDKSAELAKRGKTLLTKETGLTVQRENPDIRVLGTTVLHDQYGSAAVVQVKNDGTQNLRDVPVLLDVKDKKGRSVFKNNIPGLEQGLVAIPLIKAGQTLDWVNDQVLATGVPASADAKVGLSSETFDPNSLPKLDVGAPKLITDPVSGIEAEGQVVNNSGAEQRNLLLYAVARKGDQVVAAGRGLIGRLKNSTKPVDYHIFFIGDPKGAQVQITPFPTVPKE
jgi:hypothetical protein